MDDGNGAAASERPNGVQRVSISYCPHTHHADIDLGGLSLDDALSLFERAHRELDARYRFQRGKELLQESMQAAIDQQLVQNAMRDPRIKA